MIIHVQQSIHIQSIKIGGIKNSSVFQIGTTGSISPSSYLFNSGGFTKPAPEAIKIGDEMENTASEINFVPLAY